MQRVNVTRRGKRRAPDHFISHREFFAVKIKVFKKEICVFVRDGEEARFPLSTPLHAAVSL